MVSRLQYNDYDDLLTTVEWYKHPSYVDSFINRVADDGGIVEAVDCVYKTLAGNEVYEFCGTGNPLMIKWAGERYSVTAPSSAAIKLIIKSKADRDALNDIFNGGYYVTVQKEGQSGYFWKGEITPTLGMEAYKDYPYSVSLNANDGISKANKRQFLMIDFPEPWPVKTNILDFIIKLINTTLTPQQSFTLKLAATLRPDDPEFASVSIWDSYLDPRCFMQNNVDEYITNEKVLESLLGTLNLQLMQWLGEWWLLDLEAQWDAGKVSYEEFSVTGDTWTQVNKATETIDLGILDLYGCGDTEVEINNSGRIDFLAPWRKCDLVQEFQMNSCILPVYANRTGNFYNGHAKEGTADFIPLEYIENYQHDAQGNLRHWTNEGLTINNWGDNTKTNTSFGWVAIVESEYAQDPVAASVVVDPDITFSKFTFNVSTMPTYDGTPNSLKEQATPKTNIEIKYVDTALNEWWFWLNNGVGDFYGWSGDFHLLEFDEREISVTGLMPDGSAFTGGTFTVKIYNADDENVFGSLYGMLINNLRLGIIGSDFETFRVDEIDNHTRQRKILWTQIGWALIDPIGFSSMGSTLALMEGVNKYNNMFLKDEKVIGGTRREEFVSQDFMWDNTIDIGINQDSDTDVSYKYIWGTSLIGAKSYHEFHLSSPYNSFGHALDQWNKDSGSYVPSTLVDWKARQLIRDNSKYTTKLTGEYLTDKITPLQLVNDYEGRVYRFNNGTWHDKRGNWACSFVEFKALQNITGDLVPCDYSTFDYNDDYCKWTTSEMRQYVTRVTDDGGMVEAKGCLQLAINDLNDGN